MGKGKKEGGDHSVALPENVKISQTWEPVQLLTPYYNMQSIACLLILIVICHYTEASLHFFPLREPEISYATPPHL